MISSFLFLGSNFLIQRLPDEQEVGHKDESRVSRLFPHEGEVHQPTSNLRPREEEFYRRQPSDPSPTTICEKKQLHIKIQNIRLTNYIFK